MILDILYNDVAPEQIQEVRMYTVYLASSPENGINIDEPEMRIHFYDDADTKVIPLSRIRGWMTTND